MVEIGWVDLYLKLRTLKPSARRIKFNALHITNSQTGEIMSQHFDKVKGIILEVLDLDDASKITLDASFDNDLGADSIAKFELIDMLEKEFDLEITDETAQTLTTVGAVCQFLDKQVG